MHHPVPVKQESERINLRAIINLHAIIQLLVPTKTSFVVECLFEFGDLKITFINNCVEQTV